MTDPNAQFGALLRTFEREFGRQAEGVTEAPGRVNLIGEHVDYNDGLVLPFAIEQAVTVAWARRDDDAVWAYSLDEQAHARFNLPNITHAPSGTWSEYVRGVAWAVTSEGYRRAGLMLAITGTVPQGAGLSSSAALEVAVAGAFRDAGSLDMPLDQLALLCQRAENEFVGVQSGIMDQFASALAHRDAALLIDCRSLGHRDVPLRLAEAGLTLVVSDSGVRRELIASAFNERREACRQAVGLLRERLGRPDISALRDVSVADLDALANEAVLFRRARHVVMEIARVAAAVGALERGDFGTFGALMVESHMSLRDDYEVSTPELDLLVALATGQPYVLGARLTGAGFGGATISLVRTEAVDAFAKDVVEEYERRTGRQAAAFATMPQDGLRSIAL